VDEPSGRESKVTVIGLGDDRLEALSPEALRALNEADVIVAGRRHLELWQGWYGTSQSGPDATLRVLPDTVEIGADIDDVTRRISRLVADKSANVTVLASGDPGFFGIVRALSRCMDSRALRILPAPSSVSLAFARLGLPWDDAVVVSAHGRKLSEAVGAIRVASKVAVLTSPSSPPEAIGTALLEARCHADRVAVCSNLGSSHESVEEVTLEDLAAGEFPPLSVVVILGPGGLPITGWSRSGAEEAREGTQQDTDGERENRGDSKVLAWGLPDSAFDHRGGMITKSEIRSVVLGKLSLPAHGVLWDVGAGSGSVGIESAIARPGLTVFAIEASAEDSVRITSNGASLGVGVHVITGSAPEALEGLPDPDRVFVGGGGLPSLEAAMRRLRPGGRVVATFAALDRAAAAADLLGNLVQVRIDRGETLPDGSWRLDANNPVFVAWGPE